MHFWLSILLFSIWISLSELRLPEGFYRVPSCPTPNNLTAWKERSAALNCTDDLENKDPEKLTNIYNCMPSNYLNETLEFCGRMTAITEGNCPVLNYEHKATAPTGRTCSSFTDGCPPTLFFTREIYKYSACLKINNLRMCYSADPECPKNAKRKSSTESFPTNITTANLITTTEFMTNGHPKDTLSTEVIVIIILSTLCLLFIVVLLIECLGWRKIIAFLVSKMRNKTPRKQSDNVEMERMIQEKHDTAGEKSSIKNDNVEMERMIQEKHDTAGEKSSIKNDNVEMDRMIQEKDETAGEKSSIETGTKENKQNVTKDKEMGEDLMENFLSCGSEDSQNQKVESSLMPSGPLEVLESDTENRLLFNSFYFDIAKKIIDRDFMQNFSIFLQGNTVENTVNQLQKFAQWNKEYNFQCNIWHLQQLLKKCEALDLVEECTEFAESCTYFVVYFRRYDTQGMKEFTCIRMKKRKLELAERKVVALEKIANTLERLQDHQASPSEFSLSPVIKF